VRIKLPRFITDNYFFQHLTRLNLIYLTLVLHGIGTLMPWNMIIAAKEVTRTQYRALVSYSLCACLSTLIKTVVILDKARYIISCIENHCRCNYVLIA